MKKISIYRIPALLVAATIFFAACTKEQSDVRLYPQLSTSQVLNVKSDSVTIVGFVISEGDGLIQKGVCYKTSAGPTIADSKTIYGVNSTSATFTVKIGGLAFATKYYARAYATTGSGTIYGEEYTFTTLPIAPTLTTAAITAITGKSASGGGNVTVGGGATVTARGICYGTAHNPAVSGSKTSDGNGTGAFVSSVTGLKGNTVYYVRAYATNSVGTSYGPEVTFTTLVDLPAVTTSAVTAVTKVSAISGGEVTYDGGAEITARGLAWGTSANPTTAGSVITGGTGMGSFISNLPDLTAFTTYHVRAFATNSAGTAYGNDITFITLADITKFWLVGGYNGWDNSDNALYIISTATSGGSAQGYAYLTSGELKLTTDHSWDNAYTFGDNGSGALTNPGNNIQITSTGYYLVKANLSDMTYSLKLSTWGVIGDATPGSWSSQTDMVYNPASLTFSLGLHMTSGGGFKFRGTSDWSLNYGSTAADGSKLDDGGSNIAVNVEDDYAITLDLSHPNAYTYSANRWGIIGSATADTWTSDQNMSWNAVTKEFTATLDLTAGEIKFRANDDWAINLGGDLNNLTGGGGNIAVTTAGNYTITLDPWSLKATVTKN